MGRSAVKSMLLDSSEAGVKYYIKNKDKVLGEFVWDEFELPKVVGDYGLPEHVSNSVGGWLGSRTPPKHRENMKKLLDACGLHNMKDVIDYSKGLSLTDTLWVTTDIDLSWDNVSLFRNPFDEVIAHIAFDGGSAGLPSSTTSPEFGTDGMLPKCWVREDNGDIYLYKGGTSGFSNTGKEPYSEVMASQVLDALGYAHVTYGLKKYRGKLCSICKLMTSEEIMMLPIYQVFQFKDILKFVEDCTDDTISVGIAQHLIFDYLSLNTDRHAGNIGVLLDANTFSVIGMAPIYDNGCSMLNYWNGNDDLVDYCSDKPPALYSSFEFGAKLGKAILSSNHNVQNLIGFKFDRSELGDLDSDRIAKIEDWLQTRVEFFLERL